MTAVPAPFRDEYLAEVARQRRRRFIVWCGVWIALQLTLAFLDALSLGMNTGNQAINALAHLLEATVATAGLWIVMRRSPWSRDLARLAYWILIINAVVASFVLSMGRGGGVSFWPVVVSHLLACILLPWSPREALRAGLPLWLVWFASQILLRETAVTAGRVAVDVLEFSFLVPGLAIAYFRSTQLGKRIESTGLREHFEEYHREMFDARRLHEAIFPPQRKVGLFRFAYRDRPRLGIGGDLLCAQDGPDDSLHLMIFDVSGDGIAAAFTVHRIYGEIERLFAETPNLDPCAALRALDRYAHLTLMPHGIVAVMFSLQIHPDGRVCYVGAGHAPALIRRANGDCEVLESTTWPLGAWKQPMDGLCNCETRLSAGDAIILYSDGACAWRNRKGERLGYRGAESIVRSSICEAPLDWPDVFFRQLESFGGTSQEADEDVLVAAIEFAPSSQEASAGRPVNGMSQVRTKKSRPTAPVGGGLP